MNNNVGNIEPFDRVWFVHLHTNCTHKLTLISDFKYDVIMGAKARPMLVLNKYYDKKQGKYIFNLLKMSSKKHKNEEYIEIENNSYIYIENVYCYNEVLLSKNIGNISMYHKLSNKGFIDKLIKKHQTRLLIDISLHELSNDHMRNIN